MWDLSRLPARRADWDLPRWMAAETTPCRFRHRRWHRARTQLLLAMPAIPLSGRVNPRPRVSLWLAEAVVEAGLSPLPRTPRRLAYRRDNPRHPRSPSPAVAA